MKIILALVVATIAAFAVIQPDRAYADTCGFYAAPSSCYYDEYSIQHCEWQWQCIPDAVAHETTCYDYAPGYYSCSYFFDWGELGGVNGIPIEWIVCFYEADRTQCRIEYYCWLDGCQPT